MIVVVWFLVFGHFARERFKFNRIRMYAYEDLLENIDNLQKSQVNSRYARLTSIAIFNFRTVDRLIIEFIIIYKQGTSLVKIHVDTRILYHS